MKVDKDWVLVGCKRWGVIIISQGIGGLALRLQYCTTYSRTIERLGMFGVFLLYVMLLMFHVMGSQGYQYTCCSWRCGRPEPCIINHVVIRGGGVSLPFLVDLIQGFVDEFQKACASGGGWSKTSIIICVDKG